MFDPILLSMIKNKSYNDLKDRPFGDVTEKVDISGESYIIEGFNNSTLTITNEEEVPLELGQTWNVICFDDSFKNVYSVENLPVKKTEDGVLYLGDPALSDQPFYVTKTESKIHSTFRQMYTVGTIGVFCESGTATFVTDVEKINPKYLPVDMITITLSASGWDSTSKTQTVTATGVYADETAQFIHPVPAISSQAKYIETGILCTERSENSLTFTATTIPTEDLTVYLFTILVNA